MTGGEVILTYKRKRYRSARCSNDNTSAVADYPGESAEGNKFGSCTNGSEYVPKAEMLCPGDVSLQNSSPSYPRASSEEDKNTHVHDSGRLTSDTSEVLDGSPAEGRIEKSLLDPKDGSYLSSCSTNLCKSEEKVCLEGTGLTVENGPIDVSVKNKLNLPLITFHRRSKQKRDNQVLQSDVTVPASVGCRSAGSLVSCEATTSKSCLVDALEDPNFSKKNINRGPSFTQSQEKKATEEVDSSCACYCSTLETGCVKPVQNHVVNTLKSGQSNLEGISQDSGLVLPSLQAKNSVDIHETYLVEKSLGMSNCNVNPKRKLDEILNSRSADAMLDLSIRPPELSRNHDLGLLYEKPEDRNSNIGRRYEKGSSSVEVAIEKNNNHSNISPALTLKNSYLQLFPQGLPRAPWQDAPAHAVSEDRPINLLQSRTQARTTAATSSLFPGLSFPVELRTGSHACSSSLSQLPNVGVQSRGFTPERMPQSFPDQSSSFLRHKMILDNIASRATTLKGMRSNYLDNTQRPWSEEELDCLWIGVRRYGRGNWHNMLRDPRLNFLPWRTPAELAVQWEVEQSKLSNSRPCSHTAQIRTPTPFPVCSDRYRQFSAGKQNFTDEVQLSLGDVYSEAKDSLSKRFNCLNAQNNAPWQVQKSAAELNTMYSSKGNQRSGIFKNHDVLAVESLHNVNPESFKGINGGLPHWLKQVAEPPMPTDTALHAVALSTSGAETRWQGQGGLNSSRESITTTSKNDDMPDRRSVQTNNATHPVNSTRAAGNDKTDQGRPGINKQECIIINSDASSEETISDDLSVRP